MDHATHIMRLRYAGQTAIVRAEFDTIMSNLGSMTSGNFNSLNVRFLSAFERKDLETLLKDHGYRTHIEGDILTIAW